MTTLDQAQEVILEPLPVPEPPPTRSLFRVNFYVNGAIVSAYVCAFSAAEAIGFLGVRDSSAAAVAIAHPVEVSGLDASHASLPVLPVTKTEPPPPQQFTNSELERLRELLAQAK